MHAIPIIRVQQASSTGQLNTILTFYEITSAEVDSATASPGAGMPVPLLRRAITSLAKSSRAQVIGVAEGEGVRFFAGSGLGGAR